jgi:hypothetical protein
MRLRVRAASSSMSNVRMGQGTRPSYYCDHSNLVIDMPAVRSVGSSAFTRSQAA